MMENWYFYKLSSTESDFTPQGTFGNVWRLFFIIVATEMEGYYWHLVVRDQEYYEISFNAQNSHHNNNKKVLVQNVNSVEVERP